jgi:hypothetical protein
LVPDVALAPDQSPLAVQLVGEFVTVHVSEGFTTFTVPLVGFAVIVTTGTGAALTVTCIVSDPVAPRLSVAVSLNTYVPATVILVNVGVRVLPFVMVGVTGPETNDHTVLLIDPSESVADVPVGADDVVGRVIALSGPAFAVGEELPAAETTTLALAGALLPPAFVHTSVYVYVFICVSVP